MVARRRAWPRRGRRDATKLRKLVYPADVADPQRLRLEMLDTNLFAHAPAEAEGYVADALERFRATIALLPELPRNAHILELGANPYFLTRLLRQRGLDVTCANWFGDDAHFALHDRQVFPRPDGDEEVFEFDHFNVERDRFPYGDASFDLVLCCELLEHLPNDPVHLLAETHRVLRKPGGMLMLTTPNAVRLDNLLQMQRGENIYGPLSAYGTYGRHNREYTLEELRALLVCSGYQIADLFDLDLGRHGIRRRRPAPGNRGSNLFALARPYGEPRWGYPPWLFASRHALRRVVRPDLAMGYNDDLQSLGFYDLEELQGQPARWTGKEPKASALLRPSFEGTGMLVVEGIAPPPQLGSDIRLSAEIGDQQVSWMIPGDGRVFVARATVCAASGDQDVLLSTNHTWSPRAIGLGDDARELGVAVSRVALEPSTDQ